MYIYVRVYNVEKGFFVNVQRLKHNNNAGAKCRYILVLYMRIYLDQTIILCTIYSCGNICARETRSLGASIFFLGNFFSVSFLAFTLQNAYMHLTYIIPITYIGAALARRVVKRFFFLLRIIWQRATTCRHTFGACTRRN